MDTIRRQLERGLSATLRKGFANNLNKLLTDEYLKQLAFSYRTKVLGSKGEASLSIPIPIAPDEPLLNIEHGLFIGLAGGATRIEVSNFVSKYYTGGIGDKRCDDLDDHLYGNASVGSACTSNPSMRALAWNDALPTGSNHPPLATVPKLSAWSSSQSRAPSLHSGRSRWVAQARQALEDMKSLHPPGWPPYSPKYYGIAKVHTPGVSLSYWTVYAGASGVFVCRLDTPSDVDPYMIAVRDGAVNGYSVSDAAIRRYESVIYRAAVASTDQYTLRTDAPHFAGGANPVAFGIKWSDTGLEGKIVTIKGTGDNATSAQWHLQLSVGNVGGELGITGANWTSTLERPYNPRPVHSNLMITLAGQMVKVSSTVGNDLGSAAVVYQVAYDIDPVRYRQLITGSGTTTASNIESPGLWGTGTKISRGTLSASNRYRNGFTVGPLSFGEVFTAKKTLEKKINVKSIGVKEVEYPNANDFLFSKNYSGFPDVSDLTYAIREWTMGRVECSEDEVTSGQGETITAIIIPETDCEAVYLAEYTQRQNAVRRKWVDGTSPLAISMETNVPEDICAGDDTTINTACEPMPGYGFYGVCWHERPSWGPRPADWSDGRATVFKPLYKPPVAITNPCTWCMNVYGSYTPQGKAGRNIQSGMPGNRPPVTWVTTNITDLRDARSWLITPHGEIELSDNLAAWDSALQGNQSAGPVVFASAGGNSIVYQDSQAAALQATGGEDISNALTLRFVGAI